MCHSRRSRFGRSLRVARAGAIAALLLWPADHALAACDANTVLLLHMDGGAGSTSFADSSASTHLVTANGNVQIDTTQSKFGGASAHFDGSGDYLLLNDSGDWSFGSGDFTIDFWVKFNSLGYTSVLVNHANSDNVYFTLEYFHAGGELAAVHANGGPPYVTDSETLSTGVWYHIAYVRNGDILTVYRDGGVGKGSITSATGWVDYVGPLSIGAGYYNGAVALQFPLDGWLDEVRISKGIARWTSDFSPPASSYCNECESQPAGTSCTSDDLFCTGVEQCDGAGNCVSVGDPCPGVDGDGDCSESCSEATDSCTASDPEASACTDSDICTSTDQCVGGQCLGSLTGVCGDADGCCSDGCSMEEDDDCDVCVTRAIVLSDCDLRVKRNPKLAGLDRLTARCAADTCSANGGISPSTEGVRFTIADTSGIAFDDALLASECRQRPSGYQCKPVSRTDLGIRSLRLRTLTACTYLLKLKVTRADLSSLDTSQSPWVPGLIVGPAAASGDADCGDVGCPVVLADRTLCPGTCGNDDAADAGEQCDGVDDANCPGRCDPTCTCR